MIFKTKILSWGVLLKQRFHNHQHQHHHQHCLQNVCWVDCVQSFAHLPSDRWAAIRSGSYWAAAAKSTSWKSLKSKKWRYDRKLKQAHLYSGMKLVTQILQNIVHPKRQNRHTKKGLKIKASLILQSLPRYDYSYRYRGSPASKGMIAPGKRVVILTGALARDHDKVQKEVRPT